MSRLTSDTAGELKLTNSAPEARRKLAGRRKPPVAGKNNDGARAGRWTKALIRRPCRGANINFDGTGDDRPRLISAAPPAPRRTI